MVAHGGESPTRKANLRRHVVHATKRKDKVAGEMAIVFATYNLRGVVNIMGAKVLINALKGLLLPKKARIYPFCGGLFIRHKIMPINYAPRRIVLMALCDAA